MGAGAVGAVGQVVAAHPENFQAGGVNLLLASPDTHAATRWESFTDLRSFFLGQYGGKTGLFFVPENNESRA